MSEPTFTHSCPLCAARLLVKESMRGEILQCPQCERPITIPGAPPIELLSLGQKRRRGPFSFPLFALNFSIGFFSCLIAALGLSQLGTSNGAWLACIAVLLCWILIAAISIYNRLSLLYAELMRKADDQANGSD